MESEDPGPVPAVTAHPCDTAGRFESLRLSPHLRGCPPLWLLPVAPLRGSSPWLLPCGSSPWLLPIAAESSQLCPHRCPRPHRPRTGQPTRARLCPLPPRTQLSFLTSTNISSPHVTPRVTSPCPSPASPGHAPRSAPCPSLLRFAALVPTSDLDANTRPASTRHLPGDLTGKAGFGETEASAAPRSPSSGRPFAHWDQPGPCISAAPRRLLH